MIVVLILLPLALMMAVGFVLLFVWATRDGQFDDTKSPQLRVLFEDDTAAGPEKPNRTGAGDQKEHS